MHPRRVLCILVLIINTDQYFEMGSDIEMICQSSCSPGKIYWKLNNVRVDDSLSKTFNTSHTILQLKNFSQPSATLQCISYSTNQILGGTTIKTYSKPSKISCILEAIDSWYLPEEFICSWEHPMNSSLKINYTVSSQCLSCVDKNKKICNTTLTSCKFNTTSLPKIGHDTFVTVTAETAAWEAHSDIYTFHYYQILKMKPPDISVKARFTGKNHLLVKLDRKDYGKRHVIHYQVKYSKAHNGTKKQVINESINLKEETGNVTINVESCIDYTVSARWALEKAPWSNWSENKIVRSKLNKSAIKLGLWRKVDEPEINGIRKVHAMWTEIPPTCEGEFHYTLHSTPMDEMNYTAASCGPSTCDTDVNHNAHRITLTVFHNGNLLANESTYIPAIGESLPQVDKLHTSTHEGYILVSWKAPSQPVSGYMIDWTHNGSQYFWKESKYTNTTISKLMDFTPYNITVTPLLDHKTGLETQASQICSKRKAPETITFTNVVAKDKSALVSWTMEPEQCSDVVVNFTVFYRADKGPLLNATVDGTIQEVLLEDLEPDTQYVVYVTAIAITGNTSSSERYFETKKYDPSLIAALSIYGSVAIFLVLSFGLCCAFLWKKFRDKMVPNPGLSSLALWLSQSHQKILQPFSTPYESHTIIETVYPCEPDRTTTGTGAQATAFNDNLNSNLISDQAEEKTDLASFPTPVSQEERPVKMVERPSPQESIALLASESGPRSPYRSQSSAENSELNSPEQCTHLLGLKQQIKTAPVTMYVSMDMFEQGQDK
ncbi:interleukin-31 receptor subunit alpha-like isoform X2 [Myripristis murdjan]|uniref:interleukin-31 receptor subunit alpha-like isoform X2 n=1 Tax=Myripristis murdjan TaxID=586833 RepID=UPI00117639C8|nr:interleukin-31 receptor subunit alpha-like isoform X2 [Myripristis murdjan]